MEMIGEVALWTILEVGLAALLAYWLRPIVGEMIERERTEASDHPENSRDQEDSGEER